MKRRWGAALLSWCSARGKEEGIDLGRELRPAAPSTQASPAVRRESSDPSIGAGMQIRVASLYKAEVDASAQESPSIFVRPPEYSSNSHWTADILLDDPLYEDATSFFLTQHTAFLTVREVPRGVVTGRLGHAGTAKQPVHCDQGARGSWGRSPHACWRYNVDYLETSSS